MSKTEKFQIDGHKLHLHPRRVADWLDGKPIAPIYVEVSPSGACNHRCRFCSLDFMGYRSRYLPADEYAAIVGPMARAGVKSIMFAGDGEPFMHRRMGDMTKVTKEAGIDVAFTSNGVLLKPETARQVLPYTSWIKVSFNAGTPETYARIHGAGPNDFSVVLNNLSQAVKQRQELGGNCALGFQMVLLPENRHEAATLARLVRDIGADYLVIKPHSIHRLSGNRDYDGLVYDDGLELLEELAAFNSDSFKVIFRAEAMRRRNEGLTHHQRCLALPFWAYIDSRGLAWSCLRHINEEQFYLGDIFKDEIDQVFLGSERAGKISWCSKNLDISDCHTDCRMEPINAYLWDLTHPAPHDNFI